MGKLRKIEMMRGFASIYVMAVHFLPPLLAGKERVFTFPLRFGQEAVMLFFMISGFVVYFAAQRQQPGCATYFVRRWTRIYPIFLLALSLSAFDLMFLQHRPVPVVELLGNLFMMQDFYYGQPGVWFPAFAGNYPLWSLAYEWWFYLLFFPIWRFVPSNAQKWTAAAVSLAGLVCYVIHPNQPCLYLTYFILWWTGAEFAREYLAAGVVTFRGQRASLCLLASFLTLVSVLLPTLGASHYGFRPGFFPMVQIRHFAACLFIALGGLWWAGQKWRGFNALFGIFARLAPVSYGIYVLHYPIGVKGSFFTFLPPAEATLAAVAAVLAGAWFAEFPYQAFFRRLTNPLLRRKTNSPSQEAS